MRGREACCTGSDRMKIKAVEVCIITEKVPAEFLCFPNNYIAFSVALTTMDCCVYSTRLLMMYRKTVRNM
jgi:hypothetical protein